MKLSIKTEMLEYKKIDRRTERSVLELCPEKLKEVLKTNPRSVDELVNRGGN